MDVYQLVHRFEYSVIDNLKFILNNLYFNSTSNSLILLVEYNGKKRLCILEKNYTWQTFKTYTGLLQSQ